MENGCGASSVKALSETLGITRSRFYNAFGNRVMLFVEAIGVYYNQSPYIVLNRATPDMPVNRLLTNLFRAACKARETDLKSVYVL